jgi:hypothetical protein
LINWFFFHQSIEPPALVKPVVSVFESVETQIASPQNKLDSNAILSHLRVGLEDLGFQVESGKKKGQKITVPVLFGKNGKPVKSYDADAYHEEQRFVLEVEAGRAVSNNQFLKDLLQACLMVNVDYIGIAVRNTYTAGTQTAQDFEYVRTFFETLQVSRRFQIPLKGVLLIGY